MKKWLLVIGILFFCTAENCLRAQTLNAEALLDRYAIRIGEQFTLKLAIRYTEGTDKAKVIWPVIDDSLNPKITVISHDTVSTKLVDRASVLYEQKCNWTLTSFDSGLWVIPPIPFVVNDDTVWTQPLELYVNTVQVDTTKPIKPLVDIYDVPPPPKTEEETNTTLWWWIGSSVFVIAAVVIFLLMRKKKETPPPPPPPAHVLLPHERVLAALNEMAIKKPWRDGNMKAHYTALTELMRGWVVERFRFPAMEMTTYQIMMRLRRTPDSGNKTSELEHVLRTADLVKFGKQAPEEYVNEKCIQHAIDFVISTSYVSVIAPPVPPPNPYQQ
jgi:hypothetical protein